MLQNVISDNLVVAAERETLDPCYWSQNRPAEKHPKVKIDNSEINLERIMFKWIRTWSIIKIKKINNKIDFLFLFSYWSNWRLLAALYMNVSQPLIASAAVGIVFARVRVLAAKTFLRRERRRHKKFPNFSSPFSARLLRSSAKTLLALSNNPSTQAESLIDDYLNSLCNENKWY